MKYLLTIFSLSFGVIAHGQPRDYEVVDLSTYGNCSVYNFVDYFADDSIFVFGCRNSEWEIRLEANEFGCRTNIISGTLLNVLDRLREPNLIDRLFGIGEQYPIGGSIYGAARVDREEAYTNEDWVIWDDGSNDGIVRSYIVDCDLFNTFLEQMSTGNRVAVGLDNRAGTIILSGAGEAIADYIQRILHLIVVDESMAENFAKAVNLNVTKRTTDILDNVDKKDQDFGDCSVSTITGDFSCRSSGSYRAIEFSADKYGCSVELSGVTSNKFEFLQRISATIKVEDNETHSNQNWRVLISSIYTGSISETIPGWLVADIHSCDLANTLLEQMSTGKQIEIGLENETGIINLSNTANEAIADYRRTMEQHLR